MPVDSNAAKSIFLAALEQADRSAYLDAACADPDLRARVEALLKAHESGSFPDYMAAGDETRTAALTPGDPERTSPEADGPTLTFLAPPRVAGNLGRVDHYEVLSVLGQGGMGIVLKAHDESLDRVVAIKVLGSQYAANGTARRRFIREAKAVAAVTHEHVVAVHGVNEQVPYLVMQLVSGLSLQDRIDRTGPLQVTEVLRIGMQIAAGLGAAHAQGIVHRDIKPSNILLENGVERVKITDFGLARAVDDASVTQSGVIAGTPMFMSPEQARGEAVDPRSDLFSLGSVLYAMCTGHAPFRASGTMAVLKRVIEDTPRPLRELNPDLPDWLEGVVFKLLAKQPGDRFQTAKEVAQLLEQHLAHERQPDRVPMPARVSGSPSAKRRPAGRRRLAFFWCALALLVPVIFLIWKLNPIVRSKGYLLVETDIPGLEVQVGDERVSLTANHVREPFRASGWASGATLLHVRPGAYKVVASKDGSFVDEQQVVVVIGETSHVAFRMPPPRDDPGWQSLMNKQDLSKWTPHPDQPGNWKVENGILTGRAPKGSLFTDRGDYKNFHLRVEGKFKPGAQASLSVRAPASRKTKFGDLAPPAGYAVQINGFYFKDRRIGTIAGFAEAADDYHLDSNRWFKLEVIVEGTRIITKVNDKTAVDFVDPAARYDAGHIALHLDGVQASEIQFRRIEIKELPAPIRDEDRLQGTWRAVGGERHEKPLTPDEQIATGLTFTGDRLKVSFPPKGAGGEGTFTINPTSSPKQITFKATTENNQAMEGIYRFEGDRLVMCMCGAADPRPTTFATKAGTTYVLATFEREPAAGAKPFALTPPKVLEHMVGTWAVEVTSRPDSTKSATVRHAGRTVVEPVAGGRFIRMRTVTDNGGPDDLQLLGFDRDIWEFGGMYLDPTGAVFGPSIGLFDAEARTLITTTQPEDGTIRVLKWRFSDADTINWELVGLDRDGKTLVDRRGRMTRLKTAGATPPDDAGADRPKELGILDRLAGAWDTDMASRVRRGEKWRAEMTCRKVLGGRFIEVAERVLPSGEEHYTLYTFDPKRSAYKSWYFSSRWASAEGTGTWDEAAKTMSWLCEGGQQKTSMNWKFVAADRIEFRVVVRDKDRAAKVLEDLEGTHTRRAGSKK